jgi:hypothetical protein
MWITSQLINALNKHMVFSMLQNILIMIPLYIQTNIHKPLSSSCASTYKGYQEIPWVIQATIVTYYSLRNTSCIFHLNHRFTNSPRITFPPHCDQTKTTDVAASSYQSLAKPQVGCLIPPFKTNHPPWVASNNWLHFQKLFQQSYILCIKDTVLLKTELASSIAGYHLSSKENLVNLDYTSLRYSLNYYHVASSSHK